MYKEKRREGENCSSRFSFPSILTLNLYDIYTQGKPAMLKIERADEDISLSDIGRASSHLYSSLELCVLH